MTTLEEQLAQGLQGTVSSHGLVIDQLHYKKRGKDSVLEIYVEREDLSSVDLDAIVSLSEDLSAKLDELDLIQENYCLDVSTSGADKPIRDFSKFPLLVGRYMEIRVKNPIRGANIFLGTLEAVDGDILTLVYKEKTRDCRVEIATENIGKAKLTVKL